MKKCIKIVVWSVAVVAALVLVLLLSCPLWLGPVVTSVANNMVPKITETDFKLESFYLNPYSGKIRIGAVNLANPEGYAAKDAVRVKSIAVDIVMSDLFGKLLHIANVEVVDPYASYLSKDSVNNFDAILANVKRTLKLKDEKKEEKEESQMRVRIDHLRISGVSYRVGPLPIDLPLGFPIVLNDLGATEDEKGVTFKEMGATLVSSCSQMFSKGGAALKNLTGSAQDAVKSLGDGAASLGNTATDAAKSAGNMAGDAAKAAGDAAKGLFKNAGKLFGN